MVSNVHDHRDYPVTALSLPCSRSPVPHTDHTRWIAENMAAPDFAQPRSILDLLNYQMYLVLSFSSAGVTRMCEREFGITRHEWGFLALLAAFGPLAPSELALRSGMDRSRTSKALMPLAAKGLIARHTVAHDRRRAEVALSSAGRRLVERVFPRVLQVHRELLQPFKGAEVAVLSRLLHRLLRRAIDIEMRSR
jgi:DNA-binding MarR family transcriptional regulator